MPKRIDLVGQKFSHLTVIALDEEKTIKSKRSYWIVECDCPDKIRFSVLGSNLKNNNTTKCKYCKAENLIGQKFYNLTVVKRVINEKDHVMWEAICDCGNKIIVRGDSLRSGHTRSCGCLQKKIVSQINQKNLIGFRFGHLVVKEKSLRVEPQGGSYWYCDCDCGTTNHEVSQHHLTSGRVLSCGCIKSKGEEKISQILSNNNISFEKEYRISNCQLSTGGYPRFDFAIKDNNNNLLYFIEYHGEQHYHARGPIYTEERVLLTQLRDEEKIEYCKEHNIPLIIIPYTKYKDLSINDLILSKENKNII